jgi:hypothetical protein
MPIPLPRPMTSMKRCGRPATAANSAPADLLLRRGANITAVPDYADGGTILDITAGPDTRRELMLTWLRERGATRSTKT